MTTMYKWQQIKALRGKGMGIKSIAKRLNVSKNTVRKYLRGSGPPHFKAREYEKMLNKYEDDIKGMIEKRYIGTRIYSELTGIGYGGSLPTVHRYIRDGYKARRDKWKGDHAV